MLARIYQALELLIPLVPKLELGACLLGVLGRAGGEQRTGVTGSFCRFVPDPNFGIQHERKLEGTCGWHGMGIGIQPPGPRNFMSRA